MDYNKLKVAELRALAEERGIRDLSGVKKKELVELLTNIDKMKAAQMAGKSEDKTVDTEKTESTLESRPEKGAASVKPVKSVKPAKPVKVVKTEIRDVLKRKIKPAEQPEEKIEVENIPVRAYDGKVTPKEEYNAPEEGVQNPSIKDMEDMDNEQDIPDETEGSDGNEVKVVRDSSGKEIAEGILEVLTDGYGFIRSDNYMPGEKDIYVSPSQIRKFRLRTGDIISGPIRRKSNPNEKFSALLYIDKVNGYSPAEILKRKKFEDMTPIFPDERIHLDYTGAPVSLRIVDLFSPIGKGQRGMIVSPPKAGKTTLLKQIAKRISVANPEMNLLVLLIDERPEEVTDIKESIEGPNAEVIYSTFDELPEHHKRVSEMVIERAKRLVESGNDVVILVDSITRLARAYNLTVAPSGRTLSGGLDPAALHMPKKFFGAARNMREGGSLTILATALIDTGSRMDDVVYEEFKGTGNMELVLDRNLQEKRVFPAIDISKSGTRKDDLLLSPEEQEILDIIHRRFHSLKAEDVTEDLLKLFAQTKNNEQFVAVARKLFIKR